MDNLGPHVNNYLNLFSPPPDTQTLEQHKQDEQIDIKLLKLIRQDILPCSASLPKEFVDTLMKLLNKGSIHSATSNMFDSKLIVYIYNVQLSKGSLMLDQLCY